MILQKELLTVEDISAVLKIEPNTIHSHRWKERTGCPLKKIGKRLYVENAEFWRWFKNKGING